MEGFFNFVLRPQENADETFVPKKYDPVGEARTYISAHVRDKLTCRGVADAVGANITELNRRFPEETGLSLRDYINKERMEEAKKLLDTTTCSIGAIANQLGYPNAAALNMDFKRYEGCSPIQYRDTKRPGNSRTHSAPYQKPDYVKMGKDYIGEHLKDNLTCEIVARELGTTAPTLYKYFLAETGMTMSDYITMKRLEEAERLLAGTNMVLEEICRELGFSGPPQFCKSFKRVKGMSPGEYRKQFNDSQLEEPVPEWLEEAKQLLAETDLSMEAIAEKLGFASTSVFYRSFSRYMKTSAGKYRKKKSEKQ